MNRILIPTMVGDDHARAVCCAAERRGHDVVRWFTADYPSRQSISCRYRSGGEPTWSIQGPALNLNNQRFDVVWLRRPVPPVLPDTLHPDDIPVALMENTFFHRSLWYALAGEATWINSYPGHLAARSKLLQLREATIAGFRIPPTLISNDPAEILEFIQANRPGRTIYKSFYPARWDLADGGAAILETTLLDEASLPDPAIMRLTPGIFQPYIDKAFEVRATFFGAHAVALRLNSQQSERGKTDYRSIPLDELEVEIDRLPPAIYRSCRRLMRALGIWFGCFDFIVTPDQEFIFLEVNEMGQFLWQEQLCPKTRILDVFLDFLARPSADFTWQPRAEGISLDSVVGSDEYRQLAEEERTLHVDSSPAPAATLCAAG